MIQISIVFEYDFLLISVTAIVQVHYRHCIYRDAFTVIFSKLIQLLQLVWTNV